MIVFNFEYSLFAEQVCQTIKVQSLIEKSKFNCRHNASIKLYVLHREVCNGGIVFIISLIPRTYAKVLIKKIIVCCGLFFEKKQSIDISYSASITLCSSIFVNTPEIDESIKSKIRFNVSIMALASIRLKIVKLSIGITLYDQLMINKINNVYINSFSYLFGPGLTFRISI